MISVPIWLFVILVILASITALFLIFILISLVITIFTPSYEYEDYHCPEFIEVDPDNDPEHIPTVEREKD